MKSNSNIWWLLFLFVCALVGLAITGPLIIKHNAIPANNPAKNQQEYTTTASAQSVFSHGLAYFKVEQSNPSVIAVKPISIFHKMITETCRSQGKVIIQVTPCGTPVMIDGELAYSAMLVIYAN